MKKYHGLFLVLLLSLAAVIWLTGCGSKSQQPNPSSSEQVSEPQPGGTLRAYVNEPKYIDPYNAQETEGMAVVHAVFTPLVQVDPTDASKLVPGAAVEWTPNDDATVWTFKLNPEGAFSDGTPVTATDFVYAFNRIANPNTVNTQTGDPDPSTINYHLGFIQGYDDVQDGKTDVLAGLKAIDDTTLEITLSQPFADFAYVVSHPALGPVPKAAVENGVDYNGQKVAFADFPVGNGPFKLSEPWAHDQYIKVIAADTYKLGEAPYLDGIDFMIYKDPATAYREFQAGNLDYTQIADGEIQNAIATYGESPDGYTSNPGQQVLLGAENSIYYLAINNKVKGLDDPNVRKAINLAINRQAICDVVFEGTREPADNIVPPGIAGYQAGAWVDSHYDIEAAKQALVDAGYPEGKGLPTFSISFNSDGGHEKIMELIQSDLEKIGITVRADSLEWSAYIDKLQNGNYDLARFGWVADYPIAYNFLYPLFDSESADNVSFYADKAVDAGIAEAEKTTDITSRLSQFSTLSKTIGDANPVAPVMFYKHHHVTGDTVHDFTLDAQYLVDYVHVWLGN